MSDLWNALFGGSHGGHRSTYTQIHGNTVGQPGYSSGLSQHSAAAQQANIQALLAHYGAGQSARQSGKSLAAAMLAARYPGQVFIGFNPAESIEEPESAGIKLGEVTGWRGWRVVGSVIMDYENNECRTTIARPLRLSSVMNQDCVWSPDKTVEAHSIGVRKDHGVHAFKTEAEATQYIQKYVTWYAGDPNAPLMLPFALGQVSLWGQIYEFESGWHGEFAKVLSIDQVFGADCLGELRAAYGVAEDRR